MNGTTTAGNLGNNALVVNTGAGNATFNGAVNGTTVGGQSLTVNSSGVTTFTTTIGATTALSSLTTDAPGTSVFGGSVTVSGAAPTTTTPLISINDTGGTNSTTAPVTMTSTNGGQIQISNFTFATGGLSLSTSGTVALVGLAGTTTGTTSAPLTLVQTPLNLQTTTASNLTYSSPAAPTFLIFQPGSSVSAFIGGSASAVTQAANASQAQASQTVSSVQGTAASAVAEASKVGFDTDSVAQQINYGFAGDVGVSPPMDHRIDETGVSVPEGFGEDEEDEDEKKKKEKREKK